MDWDSLPEIQATGPGDVITFDWLLQTHTFDRNVALVPILNGVPLEPVTFRQVISRGVAEQLSYTSSFTATMPASGIADVYVAEWFDPFYPPADQFAQPVHFPPDDRHQNEGKRVHQGGPFGGTNMLRYEVIDPE